MAKVDVLVVAWYCTRYPFLFVFATWARPEFGLIYGGSREEFRRTQEEPLKSVTVLCSASGLRRLWMGLCLTLRYLLRSAFKDLGSSSSTDR